MNKFDTVAPASFVGTNPITVYNGDGTYTHQQSPFCNTSGGLTKYEHFMLEITKALISDKGSGVQPKILVNRAQLIFEELKKRLEDIDSKGLLSDDGHNKG